MAVDQDVELVRCKVTVAVLSFICNTLWGLVVHIHTYQLLLVIAKSVLHSHLSWIWKSQAEEELSVLNLYQVSAFSSIIQVSIPRFQVDIVWWMNTLNGV